jgi:diguanylate cyclase (GGDEF)-like protein
MRLVVEGKGYADYPEHLNSVELTPQDAALSSEEKLKRATEIVFSDEYFLMKESIRSNVKDCQKELEQLTSSIDDKELSVLRWELRVVRLIILLLIVIILLMVWLTSYLGINPVLKAVDQIKSDSPIPEVGANEFRYLAQAYNKMYSVYKNSIAHLNFKASHDELTGAYDRAGYDLLLTSIDMENTYMLLFDVDNFKSINDTFGHETGDKVLVKLVQILKNSFRADDHICRIGGDEFLVILQSRDLEECEALLAKFESRCESTFIEADGAKIPVCIAKGFSMFDPDTDTKFSDVFNRADNEMYKNKKIMKAARK